MRDSPTETARAATEDLIEVLQAYAFELKALDPAWPGVGALRLAIGAALAEARLGVPDWHAEGPAGRTRH